MTTDSCPTCGSDEKSKRWMIYRGSASRLCTDPWHSPAPQAQETPQVESRSFLRRKALMKGEPMPTFVSDKPAPSAEPMSADFEQLLNNLVSDPKPMRREQFRAIIQPFAEAYSVHVTESLRAEKRITEQALDAAVKEYNDLRAENERLRQERPLTISALEDLVAQFKEKLSNAEQDAANSQAENGWLKQRVAELERQLALATRRSK